MRSAMANTYVLLPGRKYCTQHSVSRFVSFRIPGLKTVASHSHLTLFLMYDSAVLIKLPLRILNSASISSTSFPICLRKDPDFMMAKTCEGYTERCPVIRKEATHAVAAYGAMLDRKVPPPELKRLWGCWPPPKAARPFLWRQRLPDQLPSWCQPNCRGLHQ